ncbi:MAG: PspA/IM30 family protein [Agarilytica sp.]
MKVKRIVASVGASFEQFVAKMENHDAVAKCVINDIRQSAARIRSEKNRVAVRLERYQKECEKLETEKQLWLTRAKSCLAKQQDDAKAIECMSQVKAVEKQLEQVKVQAEQTQNLHVKLLNNLQDIEQKLEELESKRAILSSREARANVVSKLNNGGSEDDPLQIFERWETEVMSNEYVDISPEFEDANGRNSQLDREFSQQEDTADLQQALERLKEEMLRGGNND